MAKISIVTVLHSLPSYLREQIIRCVAAAGRLTFCAAAIAGYVAFFTVVPKPVLAEQPIAQRIHTSWRSREGAPAGIRALAQSADGMLWIGSQSGLFSFDGKTFVAMQSYAGSPLPSGGVTTVLAARGGAVWVGFMDGEAVQISQGNVHSYSVSAPGQADRIIVLKQGEDGSIWCATSQRLLRLENGRFAAESLPPHLFIRQFVSDGAGNDWLGTQDGLLERLHGSSAFTPVPGHFGIILALVRTPGSGVLVSDFDVSASRGRTQRLDETGNVVNRLPGHDVPYDAMIDQDGYVWLGTQTLGLRRTSWPAPASLTDQASDQPADGYRRADGLTSDGVYAVLQDRDGNIWAGTRTGLDRFRVAALSAFSVEDDASTWFVCSGLQGDVWIADTAGKLYHVLSGNNKQYRAIDQNINALACGRQNDAWFSTPASFWHAVGDDVQPVPKLPGLAPLLSFQLVQRRSGTLLANTSTAVNDGGAWSFRDNAWSRLTELEENGGLQKVAIDGSDRIWIIPKKPASFLERIDTGKVAELRAIPPEVGRVGPVISSSFGFLVGGQNGIALSTGGDFHRLSIPNPDAADDVSGLVQARNGDIWFIASRGIVHIAADQISKAASRPGAAVRVDLFQENDFVGRIGACSCWNEAAIGSDGKLWFAGLTGVVSIDPSTLPPKPHAPLVLIKSILADEQPPNSRHQFQPNPHTLRIAYAGINLSEPDSVVYQYKLDGLDRTWQNVGKRTEATYTSLRPGSYTFQVIASNSDGNWTRPLIVPLTILPSFYQTYWFILVGSLSFCAFLWFMQSLYVRNVIALTRARADARADERIRISQDIHDTLLQGVQGLLLHVGVAAKSVPQDHPSASMLERALSAATRIIVEGRESVSALRPTPLVSIELVSALEQVGRDLNVGTSIEFSVKCSVSGGADSQRPLLIAHVGNQAFYAAREAITNAFQHADASHISVILSYGKHAFTLQCNDDGVGFVAGASQDTCNADHWGLRGMRERVANIGGKLKLQSAPTQGTAITILIPASCAYRRHVWWKRLPRLHQSAP